jgi:hypothetical protein
LPYLFRNLVLQKISALVRKSFIAQFLNTAIIAIVVSARLPKSVKNPVQVLPARVSMTLHVSHVLTTLVHVPCVCRNWGY